MQDASTSQPFSSWLGSIDEADILVTATDSMDMPLLPADPREASTIATSASPFAGADSTLAAASATQQSEPADPGDAQSQSEASSSKAVSQLSPSADSDAAAASGLPDSAPDSALSQQPSQSQTNFGEERDSAYDSAAESGCVSLEDLAASPAGLPVSEQNKNQPSQNYASSSDGAQAAGTSEALQKAQVRFCTHLHMVKYTCKHQACN